MNNNEMNPKRAIAVVVIICAFAVGGFFVSQWVTRDKEDTTVMAETTPSPTPSPTVEATNEPVEEVLTTPAPTPVSSEDPEVNEEAASAEADEESTSAVTPTATPAVAATETDSSSTDTTTSTGASDSTDSEPAAGSTNESGQMYVPGFGWVTPTTGQSIAIDGDGDIDKQVGTMG